MNCRECKEHLYEYLDRELTPAVEQEIRQHIADCPPCGEEFDFEKLFLGFLRARCRAQGAPPDLKRRILDELRSEERRVGKEARAGGVTEARRRRRGTLKRR